MGGRKNGGEAVKGLRREASLQGKLLWVQSIFGIDLLASTEEKDISRSLMDNFILQSRRPILRRVAL